MALRASVDGDGTVVAWSHESFSDTYNMRPRPGPNKIGPARLLATRHLADALDAPVPQPAMVRHVGIHRNLDPLYNFADRRLVKHLVRGMPLRTLGAPRARRLRQCLRDRVLHGRTGRGHGPGSDRIPVAPSRPTTAPPPCLTARRRPRCAIGGETRGQGQWPSHSPSTRTSDYLRRGGDRGRGDRCGRGASASRGHRGRFRAGRPIPTGSRRSTKAG